MDILSRLQYEMYAEQRAKWFNPNTCSSRMLESMKKLFPQLDQYEVRYIKEASNV